MTNWFALLIVTNMVRAYCPHCDKVDPATGLAWMEPVLHDHKWEQVVTTNYLPVVSVVVPDEREE